MIFSAFSMNDQPETKKSILKIEEQQVDPLLDFINQILCLAIQRCASDIHFEPYQTRYRIRIRINGLLEELPHHGMQHDKRIAARLKTCANLDTTERRLPQDGQLQLHYQNQYYDLRISTCPTIYGEKIVLRILYYQQQHTLIELGLNTDQQQRLTRLLHKPQGLILVCGPTGSGKTMTLYAALDYLNQPNLNIVSVEDPVEVHLSGINQVAVNPAIHLSFQRSLRSILRQDPDVIMVGEIRDTITAKITIKAAQTGHLVLSTLHSNSALKALSRLRQMGIPTYDLVDSISLLISQRLLRKLCSYCKIPYSPPSQLLRQFKLISCDTFYRPQGCEHCYQGYQTRFAIFELIELSSTLIDAILTAKNILQLDTLLTELKIKTLQQSALDAFNHGLTSWEEINRVVLS